MKSTNSSFSYLTVSNGNTVKLVTKLDNKKAVQSMDITVKLVKEFVCLFSRFITSNVNKCINKCTYLDGFKKASINHFIKKTKEQKNQTIGPLVSFQMFQKFMKNVCMIKFILVLIEYFQDFNATFVKVLAFFIVCDNKEFCASILTDISKAFKCTPYDPLIANLNA